MLHKIKKIRKYLNLLMAYMRASKFTTTPFVRIIPTDRCNLSCSYCWQHNNKSIEITEQEYKLIIEKAKKMKVGMINFLGGEPLIWKYIYSAIELCNKYNIMSDITTNGTLLNEETLNKLGESGLDSLNISVDGKTTEKNIELLKNNLRFINEVRKKYGIIVRINAVLYKNNFEEIKELIEYCNSEKLPLSIGYVVPIVNEETEKKENGIYFIKADRELIREIVTYMREKISKGYKIIDPIEYFENIEKFIRKEKFWECNYSGKYGWINVIGNCKIRSCTKKMDDTGYDFLELKKEDIIKLKENFKEKIDKCNRYCYSNCAYDSFFYTRNKRKFLKKIIG